MEVRLLNTWCVCKQVNNQRRNQEINFHSTFCNNECVSHIYYSLTLRKISDSEQDHGEDSL